MSVMLVNEKQSVEDFNDLPRSLPPRSMVHKKRKKSKQNKGRQKDKRKDVKEKSEKDEVSKKGLGYPLIRLLAVLFILLPLTFIYIFTYWMNDENNKVNVQPKNYYEPIQIDGNH
ncbi:hypothetical protein GCM10008967_41970 [Bacillus carboniphilus]|uniref:Uncharacterized protein n=1 Tax=Bacillus carboniphilus TaxID=86663 RepID=A0ABN0WUU8_9BACI